jgi:hypothetical protein
LNVGQAVRVGHTRLRVDENCLWGDKFAGIVTDFSILGLDSGWPTVIKTRFDPAFYSESHGGYFLMPGDFDGARWPHGRLRPSPWEPPDTPLDRTLPWPSTSPASN